MKKISIQPAQVIAVLLSLILVISLFLFGNRIDPNKAEKAATAKEQTIQSFDFEAYATGVKAKLDSAQLAVIQPLEDSIGNASFFNIKPQLLQHLAAKWDALNHPEMASEFFKETAEASSTLDNWMKAGDAYSAAFLLSGDTTNMKLKSYLMANAVESYKKAISVDSQSVEAKVSLGGAYIDGATSTDDVMKGVRMLLDVIKADPENEQANLILGRNDIVNGQYDKAVARLETVTRVNPKNAEAWFHLGEANRALGNKDKAIESLEKFKQLTNDPDINKQVDAYIDKIKNGG